MGRLAGVGPGLLGVYGMLLFLSNGSIGWIPRNLDPGSAFSFEGERYPFALLTLSAAVGLIVLGIRLAAFPFVPAGPQPEAATEAPGRRRTPIAATVAFHSYLVFSVLVTILWGAASAQDPVWVGRLGIVMLLQVGGGLLLMVLSAAWEKSLRGLALILAILIHAAAFGAFLAAAIVAS